MMVSNKGSVFRLLLWQKHSALLFALAGTIAAALWHVFEWPWLKLPATPLTVIGAALGIFVSFRTNSAYDRWWEGRKLWGRMINESRHLCTQLVSYLGPDAKETRALVRRHAAYVHALRIGLRQQSLSEDPDLPRVLDDDLEWLTSQSNPTHALLQKQMDALAALNAAGAIDDRRMQSLDLTLRELVNIQGGCERIKKTPLPRGYGFIAERLILIFTFAFPYVVVQQLGWLTVPTTVLVGLSFALISEAGRVLEDPFTMFWNGLPLSNISTMIEANVMQRIDEPMPEIPTVDRDGILM